MPITMFSMPRSALSSISAFRPGISASLPSSPNRFSFPILISRNLHRDRQTDRHAER
jgi:hypothetical protein